MTGGIIVCSPCDVAIGEPPRPLGAPLLLASRRLRSVPSLTQPVVARTMPPSTNIVPTHVPLYWLTAASPAHLLRLTASRIAAHRIYLLHRTTSLISPYYTCYLPHCILCGTTPALVARATAPHRSSPVPPHYYYLPCIDIADARNDDALCAVYKLPSARAAAHTAPRCRRSTRGNSIFWHAARFHAPRMLRRASRTLPSLLLLYVCSAPYVTACAATTW